VPGYSDPEYKKKWAKTPRARYSFHKAHAKARGLAFDLSFAEWWSLWEPYWAQRGRKPGQYCMTRNNDTGGYVMGNVSVKPVAGNLSDQLVSGAHKTRTLSASDISEIKCLTMMMTDAEIAKRFGVSQPHVTRILNGLRGEYIAKEGVK